MKMNTERVGSPRFWPPSIPGGLSDLARIAALALIYFITGKLGLEMALFHQSASPIWPPTGIALAALLLLGYRVWPGIWLGAFLVNVTTAGSVLTAIGIATGNTLEAMAGAILAVRFAHGPRAFVDARDVFKFILLAAILSTAVSPTIGVLSLELGGFARWSDFPAVWVTWWLGDLVSAMAITPLILIWSTTSFPRWGPRRTAEALLMLALVAGAGVIVFGGLLPERLDASLRAFMVIPALLWGAYRFGPRGAVTSVFLLSWIALLGTLRGVGPFILGRPNDSLLLLQTFVGTITVTNLVLGAAASEGRRVESALRRSEAALQGQLLEIENLYQTAPVGLCLMDAQLRYVRINERLAAIHGLPVSAHRGRTLREMVPRLADTLEPLHRQVLTSGEPWVDYEFTGTTGAERRVGQHWLASCYPVRAVNGDMLGVSTVVLDITEHKLAEAELRAWHRELEARVQARTADLTLAHQALEVEAEERKNLEALMARIVEREQLRLGSELHDGLGQRLTGISLLLADLHEKLKNRWSDGARDTSRLQALVEQSIREAQSLARGFYPVELERFGLLLSLKDLARSVSVSFGVRCGIRPDSSTSADISGPSTLQLYRIAQETLHNAVQHGKATRIVVFLACEQGEITLTITDDGVGLPAHHENMRGLGLRIMRYRAQTIGGTLDVRNGPTGGVTVTCSVPATEGRTLLGAENRDAEPADA